MSSWLAIISRAAKTLPVFPQLSSFKTSLSPRRSLGNALSTTEKVGFWNTFNDVRISDNILPLFVIYSVVHVLFWVFNRIKYFIACLLAFSWSLCQDERIVNKSTLVFPATHSYHQSTVFTEYSIYWRAVDHPRVLIKVSWLKPSSALMKKARLKTCS